MTYDLLSSGTFQDYWSFRSFEMYSRLAWVRIVLTCCTCAYKKVSQDTLHCLLNMHVIFGTVTALTFMSILQKIENVK